MNTPQIFLSHAGEDADLALRIAARLERDVLTNYGPARIFNTSAPENRFRDLEDFLPAGEEFRPDEWEAELRAYLKHHIHSSAAYVLLVTPQSLRKRSKWIQFEIDTAYDEQQGGRIGFIPCAAGGARLADLPSKAAAFQGVNISEQQGFREIDRNYDQLLGAVLGFVRGEDERSNSPT